MAGAKPKITAEVEARLLQLLQAGATKKDAVLACGISDQTLLNHEKRSLDFLERMKKAEAESACEKALVISKAARAGSWQAALAWLERRRPEEWGRKDRVEVTGEDRQPIKIDIKSYSPDQLRDLRRILRAPAVAAGNGRNGAGEDEPA
jgi:hypothetical protein